MDIEKFCDQQMKAALTSFNLIVAMDYAEEQAKATGIHPDYFMPVGLTYTRIWPREDAEKA